MNMEENIAIEVRYEGETQIYNPSYRTSWQDLLAMLKCSFDVDDIVVFYVDEEEDQIALDSQEEYDEAKKVSARCQNVLRLRIYPREQCMEVDTEPCRGPSASQTSDGPGSRKRPCTSVNQEPDPVIPGNPIRAVCPFPPALTPAPPPRPKVPPRLNRALSMPSSKKQASVAGCVKKAVAELKQMNGSQPSMPNAPIKEKELIDQIVKGVLEGLDGSALERSRPSSWDPSLSHTPGQSPPRSSPIPVPQGATPKTRPRGSRMKLDHIGISCARCKSPISGVRYKCGHCIAFDLCEECEAIDGVHDRNHVFLKLKRPTFRIGLKSDGSIMPVLKGPIYADDDSPIWAYKNKKLEEKKARKEALAELKRKYREEKRRAKLEHHAQVSPMKRERIEKMAQRQAEQIMAAASVAVTPTTTTTATGSAGETTPLIGHKFDAAFMRDGNLPDGTHMQPKTKFVKSWIMLNSGNIKWNSDTKLKYLWGDIKILASDPMEIPPLSPGEEAPVCVDFEAPPAPGQYQSHWRLTQKGEQFGHRVWCNVVVDEPEILEPRCEQKKTLQEEMILPRVEESEATEAEHNENTPSSAVAHLQSDQSDSSTPSRVVSSSDLLTAQDVLSFEMLSINDDRDADKEVEGVNSPATMATPNNTPIVGLTPCISPVPQLDEKLLSRRVSEHSDLEIVHPEDVPEIVESSESNSGLSPVKVLDGVAVADPMSEHEDDMESICSSSDSDILDDYCVVPLPDCFDPTKPLDKSLIMSRSSLSSSMTSSTVLPPHSESPPLVRLPSYEESQAEVERSSPQEDSLTPTPPAEEGAESTVDSADSIHSVPDETPSVAEDSSTAVDAKSEPEQSKEEDKDAATPDDNLIEEAITPSNAPATEAAAPSVDALLSTSNPALETAPLIPLVAATPLRQPSATTSPSPAPAGPSQQTVTVAPMPDITLLATSSDTPRASLEDGVLINPEGNVLYVAHLQDDARATGPADAPEQPAERQEEAEEFHDAQDTPNDAADDDQEGSNEFQTDPVELLGYTAARAVEVAGSVVRHAFDSAASSVNALLRPQPLPTPAPYTPPSPSPMDQLIEMGFGNRSRNQELLEKHNDNVSMCVQDLLQAEDNDWHNNRH
ncbi:next to BRCA1 gene 1 protein-like [Diadema antillarum]|uniref:next to BRCA1 gene 1 protein-like n=1 Tax=Diadema antillarum TaxID=105358 RepID=UPI003A8B4B40